METTPKVGPVGRQVAANVKTLRGRIPVRELSARLEQLGRPILPSGITKIEQGARRVDVDDLAALAEAFDVSPYRLLLPGADQNIAEINEWEERGLLDPVLAAINVAVNEGVTLEKLFDYLRLYVRFRNLAATGRLDAYMDHIHGAIDHAIHMESIGEPIAVITIPDPDELDLPKERAEEEHA